MIFSFRAWAENICSPHNKNVFTRRLSRFTIFLMLLFIPIFLFMTSICATLIMRGCGV